MASRSRSPRGGGGGVGRAAPAPAAADVAAAHRVREAYAAPAQSKFRVAAVLRFQRPDGSQGTIEAVNTEPHDANIRGAICAERVALGRFQGEEAASGARVVRIVCVTDNPKPIFPGPLCREFLTSACAPDAEVLASGTGDATAWVGAPLQELLPMPSVYRRRDQPAMTALAAALAAQVQPPDSDAFRAAYAAAAARARAQHAKQSSVFPILFAAAVRFVDGTVSCMHELKGIEYGCTADAVTLLLPAMIRAREEGGASPECIVQVDQAGIAHAPFAAARSLLVEHGFGEVLIGAHGDHGEWVPPITARDSLPRADYNELF